MIYAQRVSQSDAVELLTLDIRNLFEKFPHDIPDIREWYSYYQSIVLGTQLPVFDQAFKSTTTAPIIARLGDHSRRLEGKLS